MALYGLAMLVLASPVAPDRVGKRLPVFTWSEAGNSASRDPAMLYSPPNNRQVAGVQ